MNILMFGSKEHVESILLCENFKFIQDLERKYPVCETWSRFEDWYMPMMKRFNLEEKRRSRQKIERFLIRMNPSSVEDWEKLEPYNYKWAKAQKWFEETVIIFGLKHHRDSKEAVQRINQNMGEYKKIQYDFYSSEYPEFLRDCRKRMTDLIKPNYSVKRTKETVEINLELNQYPNISAWIRKNANEQIWAKKQDWYEEILKKYNISTKVQKIRRKRYVDGSLSKAKVIRDLVIYNITNVSNWESFDSYTYNYAKSQEWYSEVLTIVAENKTRQSLKRKFKYSNN